MEKFIVWGKYCDDAINKRVPYREEHLNRLFSLKEKNILVTLGPTKCTRFLFAIFNANNKNNLREILEKDIYWQKGIWVSLDIFEWNQSF